MFSDARCVGIDRLASGLKLGSGNGLEGVMDKMSKEYVSLPMFKGMDDVCEAVHWILLTSGKRITR